jgi:hypothetical protein
MVIKRYTMTYIRLNFAFLLCIKLQPIINALHASYPKSLVSTLLYASEQVATPLMLLEIWVYAAKGHRLIDKEMERSHSISIPLHAFPTQMIFLLSIAIILNRNDYAISLSGCW